jgi:hypothetical protein
VSPRSGTIELTHAPATLDNPAFIVAGSTELWVCTSLCDAVAGDGILLPEHASLLQCLTHAPGICQRCRLASDMFWVRSLVSELHAWQWLGILIARLVVGLLFFLSGRGKLLIPERREVMRQTMLNARISFSGVQRALCFDS